MRPPSRPTPVSLNNLPIISHSKEQGSVFSMRLLRVGPGEYQEHLNGIAETQGHWNCPQPGSQCTLIPFGFYCACCSLDSQHLLRADFPDTSFQEVSGSLSSSWLSSEVLAHVSPQPSAVYSPAGCFSAFWPRSSIQILLSYFFRSLSSAPPPLQPH